MTTQTVNIQITVNGANPAAQAIGGVGNAAQRAHKSVFNLRNLLLGFTVVSLTKSLLAITDVVTRLDNRLNVLTGSQARSNELFGELFKVANATRSALEPTIDTYARLERSTIGYNLTGRQLLDLTQGINQSFKIFGNTSAEASAALVQFTQGLSVGVLRGDELRSVLEQAPRLAKAIADGLNEIPEGKELGEKFGRLFKDFKSGAISSELLSGSLRQLGATGKLTGELITKALLTQLSKLNEEFERTTPTIEDSIEIVKNNFIALARDPAFREFAKSVATALINIAEELPKVVTAIRPFVVVLAEAIGLFGDLIIIGAEFIGSFIKIFTDLATVALEAFGIVSGSGEDAGVLLTKIFVNSIGFIFNAFKNLVKIFAVGAASIGGFFAGVGKDIFLAFDSAFDAITSAAEGLINFLIDGINVFKGEQDKIAKVDFSGANEQFQNEFVNPLETARLAGEKFAATVDTLFAPFEIAGQKAGDAIVDFSERSTAALERLRNFKPSEIADTLGTVAGGKEALPVVPPLNANDQRRLDSFNQTLADLRDGADDAQEALRALERVQKQYNSLLGNEEIAKRLEGRQKQETEFAFLRAKFSVQAVQELIDQSKAQEEAAQSSLDHYRAQRLLTQALKNGLPPTQAQIDLLAEQLSNERMVLDAQREKDSILDSLTRKANQYNATLAATNELLASGVINERQQKDFLDATEVGRGAKEAEGFITENTLDPNAKLQAQLDALGVEYEARAAFIAEKQALDIENYEMYQQQLTDLQGIYERQRTEMQMESQRLQYASASTAFGDMAELSLGFVKESSGIYKTLFALSKAFAIADGVIKLNQAIMNASVSLPFPANLAAMAQVGAAGLQLLTSIMGAAPPQALKDGGWVSGPGGPRDDAVNAAVSNGEFVVNAAAAARNADLLEAINNGTFTAGQGGGMTLNLTQNINGVQDANGFRASGRQIAADTARVVERAIERNS